MVKNEKYRKKYDRFSHNSYNVKDKYPISVIFKSALVYLIGNIN